MSTAIAVGELLRKIDAGEPMLLLDVRNDEEFERWRVEGRHEVETIHRPYFDFIEDESLADQIPRDRPIYAICAKGDSSDLVAGMLRERGADARNITGGMIAYGEYLQPVRVPESAEIWQMNRRGKGCLSYVIVRGDDAVVVDPSRNIADYESFVTKIGAHIVAVFDTHVHADHISGGPLLAGRHGARYYVARGAQDSHDGLELLDIHVYSTPGHTPGSTSLLVNNHHLLTGDTLFVDSVGRPDLGGQVVEWGKMLFRTLTERVAKFPDDLVILPAHYASVSEIDDQGIVRGLLGHLRRTVPELQIRNESQFIEAMRKALKTPPAVYEQIIRVNLGSEMVEEEKASEWELGKNECAAKVKHEH
jgi:glyoxylase-like metal-dependent hydrolase (beta-lactamase superfamily II)/rhodanese-related sulfurtransferase